MDPKRLARIAPGPMLALLRSFRTDLTWSEEMKLQRLQRIPRYVSGRVDLRGGGISYIDGASLASAYRAIFGSHVYAFTPTTPTPKIIDGGANIGLASIYWNKKYPGSVILAVEPDERAFEALERNVAEFQMDRVTLLQKAIWSDASAVPLRRLGGDAARLDPEAQDAAVPAIPLSDILDEPVDLLKLDIEGAETEVLLSAGEELRKARQVFVEYHSLVGAPQTLSSILSMLEDLGFRYWLQPEFSPNRPLVEVQTDTDMDLRVNIFASRYQ